MNLNLELSLEHLYWGKRLQNEFDLRYLSQSSRMTPFLTSEENKQMNKSNILQPSIQEETLETLQDAWKRSKISSFGKYEESELIKKKRLENITWRIIAIKLFQRSSDPIYVKNLNRETNLEQSINPLNSRSVPCSPKTSLIPRRRSFTYSSQSQSLESSKIQSSTKTCLDLLTFDSKLNPLQSETNSLQPTPRVFDRMVGKIGKGAICSEYCDHGTGDFRSPSFLVVNVADGSSISPLKYRRHQIIRGKVPFSDDVPSIRADDKDSATTLIVTMGDIGSGLEVDLIYGKTLSKLQTRSFKKTKS